MKAIITKWNLKVIVLDDVVYYKANDMCCSYLLINEPLEIDKLLSIKNRNKFNYLIFKTFFVNPRSFFVSYHQEFTVASSRTFDSIIIVDKENMRKVTVTFADVKRVFNVEKKSAGDFVRNLVRYKKYEEIEKLFRLFNAEKLREEELVVWEF